MLNRSCEQQSKGVLRAVSKRLKNLCLSTKTPNKLTAGSRNDFVLVSQAQNIASIPLSTPDKIWHIEKVTESLQWHLDSFLGEEMVLDFPKFCINVQIQIVVSNHPGLKLLLLVGDPYVNFFVCKITAMCSSSKTFSCVTSECHLGGMKSVSWCLWCLTGWSPVAMEVPLLASLNS